MACEPYYRFERIIDGIDVNRYGVMRTSALFRLLQEAADPHGALLDISAERMNTLGVHWIVVRYQADIQRLPGENERIRVETWTGSVRHMLYPRYYRLLDNNGNTLLTSSALWALADSQTRMMVGPEVTGVDLVAHQTDISIPLPGRIRVPELSLVGQFIVPYSYIDRNGHMNNTRYFDAAEDYTPEPSEGLVPKQLRMEYVGEAFQGEVLHIEASRHENTRYIRGSTEKTYYNAKFIYA